jgi:hypothetical protein
MDTEALHGNLAIEVIAGIGEDLAQHPRVEEKRRPDVELESILIERGGASTDTRVFLHDGHVYA